jgi:hypothetical protein
VESYFVAECWVPHNDVFPKTSGETVSTNAGKSWMLSHFLTLKHASYTRGSSPRGLSPLKNWLW